MCRDNCKLYTAHPAKNIRTAGEKESWTRHTLGFFTPAHGSLYAPWISKNGSPSPCTTVPPSSQRRCICSTVGSAASFHYWDQNYSSPGLPDLVKSHCINAVFLQLVWLPSTYCKSLAGWEPHPPVVCFWAQLCDQGWGCSRNGGTRQNLSVIAPTVC